MLLPEVYRASSYSSTLLMKLEGQGNCELVSDVNECTTHETAASTVYMYWHIVSATLLCTKVMLLHVCVPRSKCTTQLPITCTYPITSLSKRSCNKLIVCLCFCHEIGHPPSSEDCTTLLPAPYRHFPAKRRRWHWIRSQTQETSPWSHLWGAIAIN